MRSTLAWNMAVSRTASRPEDVALCLATAIGLDTHRLLQYQASSLDRVQKLYRLLGLVGPSMLFNDRPKIQAAGYRWADEKLAQTRSTSLQRDFHLLTPEDLPPGLKEVCFFGTQTSIDIADLAGPGYYIRLRCTANNSVLMLATTARFPWIAHTVPYPEEIWSNLRVHPSQLKPKELRDFLYKVWLIFEKPLDWDAIARVPQKALLATIPVGGMGHGRNGCIMVRIERYVTSIEPWTGPGSTAKSPSAQDPTFDRTEDMLFLIQ
jgi:hypothetical protein